MNPFWNQSSATSNTTILYPWALTGQGYYAQALPSVVDKAGDYDLYRDAKLSPIEWLTKQIDDVCLLAAVS